MKSAAQAINLSPRIPLSFSSIVAEIAQFTELSQSAVEETVWLQSLHPGWQVVREAEQFGVTPFHYDEQMAKLYREGYGFIFSSLIFWARPQRQSWSKMAAYHIHKYSQSIGKSPAGIQILMLGDGAGNDSLLLAEMGYTVFYHDIGGSKTAEFARRRFEFYGLLNERVFLVQDRAAIASRQFDIVHSFEVLEHVPDVLQVIAEITNAITPGGLAIITDDFGDLTPSLPTHLQESSHLKGKTPFLFARHGFELIDFNKEPLFKPYIFAKRDKLAPFYRFKLLADYDVRAQYFSPFVEPIARFILKLPYFSFLKVRLLQKKRP